MFLRKMLASSGLSIFVACFAYSADEPASPYSITASLSPRDPGVKYEPPYYTPATLDAKRQGDLDMLLREEVPLQAREKIASFCKERVQRYTAKADAVYRPLVVEADESSDDVFARVAAVVKQIDLFSTEAFVKQRAIGEASDAFLGNFCLRHPEVLEDTDCSYPTTGIYYKHMGNHTTRVFDTYDQIIAALGRYGSVAELKNRGQAGYALTLRFTLTGLDPATDSVVLKIPVPSMPKTLQLQHYQSRAGGENHSPRRNTARATAAERVRAIDASLNIYAPKTVLALRPGASLDGHINDGTCIVMCEFIDINPAQTADSVIGENPAAASAFFKTVHASGHGDHGPYNVVVDKKGRVCFIDDEVSQAKKMTSFTHCYLSLLPHYKGDPGGNPAFKVIACKHILPSPAYSDYQRLELLMACHGTALDKIVAEMSSLVKWKKRLETTRFLCFKPKNPDTEEFLQHVLFSPVSEEEALNDPHLLTRCLVFYYLYPEIDQSKELAHYLIGLWVAGLLPSEWRPAQLEGAGMWPKPGEVADWPAVDELLNRLLPGTTPDERALKQACGALTSCCPSETIALLFNKLLDAPLEEGELTEDSRLKRRYIILSALKKDPASQLRRWWLAGTLSSDQVNELKMHHPWGTSCAELDITIQPEAVLMMIEERTQSAEACYNALMRLRSMKFEKEAADCKAALLARPFMCDTSEWNEDLSRELEVKAALLCRKTTFEAADWGATLRYCMEKGILSSEQVNRYKTELDPELELLDFSLISKEECVALLESDGSSPRRKRQALATLMTLVSSRSAKDFLSSHFCIPLTKKISGCLTKDDKAFYIEELCFKHDLLKEYTGLHCSRWQALDCFVTSNLLTEDEAEATKALEPWCYNE